MSTRLARRERVRSWRRNFLETLARAGSSAILELPAKQGDEMTIIATATRISDRRITSTVVCECGFTSGPHMSWSTAPAIQNGHMVQGCSTL